MTGLAQSRERDHMRESLMRDIEEVWWIHSDLEAKIPDLKEISGGY